jgi:sterol 3beta-glucosyltransferase
VPERFKYGDDAQDDVSAPKGGKNEPNQYMYQSVFSMIAAAGSKTDFNARYEESSDTEIEEEESKASTSTRKSGIRLTRPENVKAMGDKSRDLGKRKSSDSNKLLRSLPRLHLKSSSKSSKSPSRASSGLASPEDSPIENDHMTPQDAPVMSRMLEAEAEFVAETAIEESTTIEQQDAKRSTILEKVPSTTLLATRLMEIFGFDEPEKVVSEYPCWLLQSVLLQGYMYITQRHICFYAYLPKHSHVVSKSGYLAKRGRSVGSKYNRYWFTLKGDVLSYYQSPSDLYFPNGTVDLRYGISASVSKEKGESKDPKDFTVTTDHRTYSFKADSATSAKEWVKTLQKVIFRSRNDGDSVKISLPIENVIDVEESPVIDFADTFKVRLVASDESYAIDEVRPNSAKTLIRYTNICVVFFLLFQRWPRGYEHSSSHGRRQSGAEAVDGLAVPRVKEERCWEPPRPFQTQRIL